MPLHILVLGAAAGGGLPQWNCNGPQSRGFWTGVSELPAASQSAIAVSGDGETWAVINASPDLRAQILAHPALQPRDPGRFGLRDSPIGAVLLTNGDVDHVAGLLSLRESQAFDLFANATIHQVLRENPIFLALNPAFVAHKIAGLDQYFTLLPGFSRCQARCRFTLRAQGRWSPTRLSRKPSGWNCRPARRAFFMCRVAPRCPMTWPSASAAPSARLKTRTAAIT